MNTPLALIYQPFAAFSGSHILQREYDDLALELKKYLDANAINEVLRCAVYGAAAHKEQKRKSGEPYFIHPIAVCKILAKQQFDLPVLQAALLHDVLEDTVLNKTDIASAFSSEVARLVDGVSKLDKLKHQGPQIVQAESFKKMIVATADDPRVLIIKLADRLHNMQTLAPFRPDKQRRIAKETLDIYTPIAGRFGLFYFRIQLEDLAFSYLYPWRYKVLQKHYLAFFSDNRVLNQIRQDLLPLLQELNIHASVNKRQRHLWGLYQRMKRKLGQTQRIKRKQTFYEASRTVAIRVITDTKDHCYLILGKIHELYRPIQGKFEDYIAAPKSNGYRSLHTSALMANGNVLNIQIRTRDMHTLAEAGIISVLHQDAKRRALAMENEHIETEKCTGVRWLSRLKEVQNIIDDPLEFYNAIKKELVLTSSDMYVYTPAGEVIDLPRGATAVDFAYALDTKIGHRCSAAMVNGQPYPIYKPLAVGQTVHIITDENSSPHAGWLKFVVTEKAKAGINYYIRYIPEDKARLLGYRLLDGALERLNGTRLSLDSSVWKKYLQEQNVAEDVILAEIGRGVRQPNLVASTLLGQQVNIVTREHNRILEVNSALDSGIIMGECCYPLPHEEIIGQTEPGIGITIHRQSCSFNQVADREDWIRVAWTEQTKGLFCSLVEVQARERSGLLAEVATVIADAKANIVDFHTGHMPHDNHFRILKLWIEVRNCEHLTQIMQWLSLVNNVVNIHRI